MNRMVLPDLHVVQVVGLAAGARVSSLASGLVARGVEVTLCAPEASIGAYAMHDTGARVRAVEVGERGGPCDDISAIAALRAACAEADVVHAHGLRAGLLASLAAPRWGKLPLVVTWHPAEPGAGSPRAGLLRLLERRVARASDVVLGVNPGVVDQVRGLGARDVRLAPPAFPAVRAKPASDRCKARAELGAMDRSLVLAVGRLEPHKGYDLLLDAAHRWRAQEVPLLVAIAGEGSLRPRLQRRIEAEDLPVLLLGRREDIPDLLAAADLVVLPSRWEAYPLIAQEALSAGVPLVATEVGGVSEVVGAAAVLLPYGDPDALAAAVTDLLADPGRRALLVGEGRAQARTWPGENDTVVQILSIYDELAQRRRSAAG